MVSRFCGHKPRQNPKLRSIPSLNVYNDGVLQCSEYHTKHINILCGENVEFLKLKNIILTLTIG